MFYVNIISSDKGPCIHNENNNSNYWDNELIKIQETYELIAVLLIFVYILIKLICTYHMLNDR